MLTPTISALEAAATAGALEDWLSSLPHDDATRARIRRALEMDRRLWTEHPASLASCLLARTLDIAELEALRERWVAELDARGAPWVRPLRALPVAEGLLAELLDGAGISLAGTGWPRFLSDDVLVLQLFPDPPGAVPAPKPPRLRWSWSRGEAFVEAAPAEGAVPAPYPRIESDGWGPAYLVRAEGEPRVTLPCPEGGSASAHFSDDGRRLFVYGTQDAYEGGFVYVLEPTTLEVQRRLETPAPVSSVHTSAHDDLLLLVTYRGLVVASGDHLRPLPLYADHACLSPSGRFVATFGDGLRVWSVADREHATVRRLGSLPPCFDPTGARLVSGSRLFDGRTGAPIAEMAIGVGGYLEGGPAMPWFHLGEQLLVCCGSCAWDTRSGAPVPFRRRLSFPHWYALAYDRTGTRLAALREGTDEVELYELPAGKLTETVRFDVDGLALAMSADGEEIAVLGEEGIEVRSTRGDLLRRFDHAGAVRVRRQGTSKLRFSADGRHLATYHPDQGWRILALAGDGEQRLATRQAIATAEGFAEPTPPDWDIDADTRTVFVHRPTGTRIALPAAGPWVANPADPRYLACDALHVALRAR